MYVNGHHENTCKLMFAITRIREPVQCRTRTCLCERSLSICQLTLHYNQITQCCYKKGTPFSFVHPQAVAEKILIQNI